MVNYTAGVNLLLEPFFIEFHDTFLHGDFMPKMLDAPPELLCVHGASQEGRRAFLLLRQVLWEKHGISSCAFDFADYSNSGWQAALPFVDHLRDYLEQTSDIIDACFDSQPFSVVAVDEGTQVATRLGAAFPVRQLVLLNPLQYEQNTATITPCETLFIPTEASVTLEHLNATPALLLQATNVIRDTLFGDGRYVRRTYQECSL